MTRRLVDLAGLSLGCIAAGFLCHTIAQRLMRRWAGRAMQGRLR